MYNKCIFLENTDSFLRPLYIKMLMEQLYTYHWRYFLSSVIDIFLTFVAFPVLGILGFRCGICWRTAFLDVHRSGQDVRGNIKLSLKATLPQSGSKTNNAVEESVSTQEEPSIWAVAGDLSPNEQEKQSSSSEELPANKCEVGRINSSASSTPILIRSAAECDEVEKAAGLVQNSDTTMSKTSNVKTSKSFSQKGGDKEAEVGGSVTEKSPKIGTKVTATVYQIRTGGFVLDLGGGLRGMYRFESNGRTDFEVNDELRVEC